MRKFGKRKDKGLANRDNGLSPRNQPKPFLSTPPVSCRRCSAAYDGHFSCSCCSGSLLSPDCLGPLQKAVFPLPSYPTLASCATNLPHGDTRQTAAAAVAETREAAGRGTGGGGARCGRRPATHNEPKPGSAGRYWSSISSNPSANSQQPAAAARPQHQPARPPHARPAQVGPLVPVVAEQPPGRR